MIDIILLSLLTGSSYSHLSSLMLLDAVLSVMRWQLIT